MNCTKRFVPMKRYFDYFMTIFIFFKRKGGVWDLILRGGGWLIEDLQWVRILHLMQSNGFDAGKSCQRYFAKRQMATVRLWSLLVRVRKMSELGFIRVIILHGLVSSNDHHKPHNIKPRFNNYSIWRNTVIIRNQNKHKSSLNLVAKYRKLQYKLTSVAGRYNSRTLQVSRFGNIITVFDETVYTGQTDLKQIVSQNNKMILFCECLQCSRSKNIKSITRLLK